MRVLILTADDFGADPAADEAAEEAFRKGRLTAASLLLGGKNLRGALEIGRRNPGLGLGLHLFFGEDPAAAGRRLAIPQYLRPAREAVREQFQAFRTWSDGRRQRPDHVNGHHNLHLHPLLLSSVVRAALAAGCAGFRLCREPLRLVARFGRRGFRGLRDSLFLSWLSAGFRPQIREIRRRFVTPEESLGHGLYPALDRRVLPEILRRAKGRIVEIALHLNREEEREAVLSPEFGEAIRLCGFRLSSFASLHPSSLPEAL